MNNLNITRADLSAVVQSNQGIVAVGRGNKNIKRRENVLYLLGQGYNMAQIGRQLGISRQRVHQIKKMVHAKGWET